jgi:hypothetical protein
VEAPTAFQLLAVWERCAGRTPGERALELLALAGPGEGGSLTAGERDGALLDLRERLFGPELAGAGRCEGCGEEVEFSLRTDDIRRSGSEPQTLASFAVDGYELRARLPTTADLAAVSREPDVESARRRLVELCVLDADARSLSQSVVETLAERMARADPQADVELAFSCPGCGYEWSAPFDPGSFLWSEVDAWVRRALQDVHTLAAAYGWSESEILALGPRRHVYLELAGG